MDNRRYNIGFKRFVGILSAMLLCFSSGFARQDSLQAFPVVRDSASLTASETSVKSETSVAPASSESAATKASSESAATKASSESAATENIPQEVMSYTYAQEYQIAGIEVTGVSYLDSRAIISLSGLSVGQRVRVPGDFTAQAVDKLWKQNLFEDISLYATKIEGNRIYLEIHLSERPRLTSITYEGLPKSVVNKMKDDMKVKEGEIITDYKIGQIEKKVKAEMLDKAYLNAEVQVIRKADESAANGGVSLLIRADKKEKVKIAKIEFEGNDAVSPHAANLDFWKKVARGFRKVGNKENLAFSDARLRRIMKETKQKAALRFWKRSKYVPSAFQEDLKLLSAAYNKEGFRDFKVIGDSLYKIDDKLVGLKIKVYEGDPYYFGNITFVGNERYTSEQLAAVMNIQKGELYNEEKFTTNLMMNPQGADINSLYFDNGYLMFQSVPVETAVYNDTVDIEIRISEGVQSRFNDVRIVGNERTNDHVILRELRTVPGQLFSRTEIINSINTMRQLRFFNDETINPQPMPNADGTTDLEYQVEEVGSDQLELSGGFGGGMVVGTIGLSFNNFSLRNLFKFDRWKPLPSGDGQQLSLRAQSNGTYYWSVAVAFTEPWLGGKKPLSFSVSYNHSMQSNGLSKGDDNYGRLVVDGASVGLGQRLKWPDDYFTLYQAVSYERYRMKNYDMDNGVTDGVSNNIHYSITLQRQNLDAAMFPTTGSSIALGLELTPPFTALGSKLYMSSNPEDHYRWLEYYKLTFKAGWFFNPIAKLVLHARIRLGFMSYYSKKTGYPIFERFYLGGDGLTGFGLDGRELIGMRGYSNNSLSPSAGATAFDKITFEVRYPFSNNPMATVYALAFFEAGNSWGQAADMNPFQVYKSAGVGVRLFLSSMGMFGLDWGWGFDEVPGDPSANGSHFHFSINQSLDW